MEIYNKDVDHVVSYLFEQCHIEGGKISVRELMNILHPYVKDSIEYENLYRNISNESCNGFIEYRNLLTAFYNWIKALGSNIIYCDVDKLLSIAEKFKKQEIQAFSRETYLANKVIKLKRNIAEKEHTIQLLKNQLVKLFLQYNEIQETRFEDSSLHIQNINRKRQICPKRCSVFLICLASFYFCNSISYRNFPSLIELLFGSELSTHPY